MQFMLKIIVVLSVFVPSVIAAEDMQAQLDEQLAGARARAGLVGVGGIVLHKGEVIALSVDGLRRKGTGDLIQEDDLWHVGSITKSMTGTLMGLLVDDGVVDFDSTLLDLLPDLSGKMDAGWREVTLHNLLTHSSGAPANFPLTTQYIWPETAAELVRKRRQEIAKILSRPPKSAAGKKFLYSNIGLTIAGHIAESFTEMPYEELMQQRVFEPLGLDSAGFGAPDGDNPWGHALKFGFKSAMNPADRADNTPVMAPAGRAHMTLTDLAVYGQHHLDGELGRDTFLKTETYRRLHAPFLENYASGWVVFERNWADGKLIWHNGSNTMWYALLVILPEKEMVMAFTSNDGNFRKAEPELFTLAKQLALSSSQSEAKLSE